MTATKTRTLLDAIHELTPKHGNFIPMHALRKHIALPREEFDAELFALQRRDEIDLWTYCGGDYSPEQLDAGIPQQLAGAPLFYVSIGELEII